MGKYCDVEERTNKRGESCNAVLRQDDKYPPVLHCTRSKGHSGEHHAHNQFGKCYGFW